MTILTFNNMRIILPDDTTLYVLESSFVRYYGRADGFTPNPYTARKVYFTHDTQTGQAKIQVMFA